jgi:hypothetical protein
LRGAHRRGHPRGMTDSPIARSEVVALLFNVSDIAITLTRIERDTRHRDTRAPDARGP